MLNSLPEKQLQKLVPNHYVGERTAPRYLSPALSYLVLP